MRWASHNPQTYNWFKMQGIANQTIGLGVVPKNAKNLQNRVINAPVIYNESNGKVEKNPNYNPNKETLFQVYDGSLVSDDQLAKLDKPIENYNKLTHNCYNKIRTASSYAVSRGRGVELPFTVAQLNIFIQYFAT